ncbi:MAG: serine protease [Nanoarchaeota archaeon]
MKIKEFVGALAFVGTMALSSCSVNSDLKLENLRKEIKKVSSNKVMLESKVKYRVESSGIELDEDIRGYGNVVGNYIITVNHVVSVNSSIFQETPFGVAQIYVENLFSETRLNGSKLESIIYDKENDIAIFKLPEELNGKYNPVALGDSDKLKILDKICSIGNPRLNSEIIRCGIVSNDIAKREFEGRKMYGFESSILVFPGDSGTPVVDEKGEIIGLANYWLYGVASNIVPINKFKEYMDKAPENKIALEKND